MGQNNAFYWRATSSYGEIADLEIIQTKRIIGSGYQTIPSSTNQQSLRKPSFLDAFSLKQHHFRFKKKHFSQRKLAKM